MPDLFDCLLRPLEELVDFLEMEFLACRSDRWMGNKRLIFVVFFPAIS